MIIHVPSSSVSTKPVAPNAAVVASAGMYLGASLGRKMFGADDTHQVRQGHADAREDDTTAFVCDVVVVPYIEEGRRVRMCP